MRNKLLFLSILTLILLVGMVNAANTTSLTSPVTTTIVNSPVTFTFNISGDASTYSCVLWTNESGTWAERETDSGVLNNTATSFSARTITESTGAVYIWNVLCGTSDWAASNSTFGVDTTDPSITVNTPADNFWDIDGLNNITLTVTDNNANNCTITSTMNTTDNNTQSSTAYIPQAYTNATAFSFTGFDGISTKMSDNNTGAYTWSVSCDDDAGNTATVSSRTIWVDTTAPSAFVFNTSLWKTDNINLWNATTASDYTPQIGWSATTELNFSKYEITYFKDAYGVYNSSTDIRDDVTTRTTLTHSISTLAADTVYYILITAYDLAGNSVNMTTKNYKYSTTSIGHSLPSGWTTIMNSGNARSLSSYLNDSGATTVSYFNSTHEFVSHVSGGSNGDTSIPSGESIFLYMGSAATFADSVWNTTAVSSKMNLTNQSNSDWNVMCNRNSSQTAISLQKLDNELNTATSPQNDTDINVSVMSYIDWDVPKNIPFKANWSINNATSVKFGECVWMYLEETTLSYQELDWNSLS